MKRSTIPGLFCLLLILTGPAWSDTVVMKNGDRLTGTVIEQGVGKLVFETAYSGKIEIGTGEISSLTVDQPMQYTLTDGRVFRGMIQAGTSGETVIHTTDQSTVPLGGVESIAAIGAIPPSGPPPFAWNGNALAAGTLVRGNTDTDSYHLGARVVGEQKAIQRITAYASLDKERSDGSLTKEQYLLGSKYDRFFSEQWYGFVGLDFEKDQFKDLKLRSILSTGAGYQFYNTDDLKLSLEGGLSYTDDDFDTAPDDSYAGLTWGLNWEQKLLDGLLDFFHRHRGIKGLDTGDNILISAQTGVRFPLAAGFNATAEYDIEFDNTPPAGTEKTDHTYKLGVGYSW